MKVNTKSPHKNHSKVTQNDRYQSYIAQFRGTGTVVVPLLVETLDCMDSTINTIFGRQSLHF